LEVPVIDRILLDLQLVGEKITEGPDDKEQDLHR